MLQFSLQWAKEIASILPDVSTQRKFLQPGQLLEPTVSSCHADTIGNCSSSICPHSVFPELWQLGSGSEQLLDLGSSSTGQSPCPCCSSCRNRSFSRHSSACSCCSASASCPSTHCPSSWCPSTSCTCHNAGQQDRWRRHQEVLCSLLVFCPLFLKHFCSHLFLQ